MDEMQRRRDLCGPESTITMDGDGWQATTIVQYAAKERRTIRELQKFGAMLLDMTGRGHMEIDRLNRFFWAMFPEAR